MSLSSLSYSIWTNGNETYFRISRWIEYSVRKLLPIITKERKNHEKRKQLLDDISTHYKKGVNILSKAEKILNREDPIVQKLKTAMDAYKNAIDDIVGFIEKGKIIEDFRSD